jgi:hypothetical protein
MSCSGHHFGFLINTNHRHFVQVYHRKYPAKLTLGDLKINIGRTEWEIYFKLFYSETTEPFEIKIVWNV